MKNFRRIFKMTFVSIHFLDRQKQCTNFGREKEEPCIAIFIALQGLVILIQYHYLFVKKAVVSQIFFCKRNES